MDSVYMAAPTMPQPSFLLVSPSRHRAGTEHPAVPAVFRTVMSLQANLKADSTTKPLLQRCQDLVKIIDEYPAKVPPPFSTGLLGMMDGML